jgi:hypothetical protein
VSLVYPLIQPFQWFFATTALLNLGAQMISLGTPEKARSTAAQLVSAINTR